MSNNKSNNMVRNFKDEQASEKFAAQLSKCLKLPAIITFSGDIGVGKTTIIRALLRSMGVQSAIKSPTFSLVESYFLQDKTIHHFDLYRIEQEEELDYIGFRDYFSDQNLCCIEWPEHAGKLLSCVDLSFKLKIKETGRELQGIARSTAGEQILACLAEE